MKKIIILFSIVLITATFASAQKQVYFGLGGAAISTWMTNQNNYGMTEMDYATRFGFSGNINIGFDFNNSIGIKTEIGYTSLGQKYEDKVDSNNFNRSVALNYLQIPLLFKYRAGGENAKFFVAVGPQINMLMGAKQVYEVNGIMNSNTLENLKGKSFVIGQEDIKDRYQTIDIMVRLDFGVEIKLVENLFLDAGLTFGYGFTDVNADDFQMKDSSGNYAASKNLYGGIQIGINYAIPVGK